MAIADNIDYDPFDRPTPGQGMTAAPGSRVWEQPSQFANPKEAIAFVIGKIDIIVRTKMTMNSWYICTILINWSTMKNHNTFFSLFRSQFIHKVFISQ